MKPWLSLCVSAISLAFLYGASYAQPGDEPVIGVGEESTPLGDEIPRTKILVGPVVGVNNNAHTGGFRILDGVNCPKFTSGSAWGYMVGVTAELQRSTGWSVIPRITYESRPAHFKEQLDDALVLLPDQTTVVNQSVSATSDITYKLLNAEVLYSRQLFSPGRRFHISLAAGPAAGWVLDAKIRQVQDLEEPLNARFLNPDTLPTENFGRRLIYRDNEDVPQHKKFRFSLKAGIYAEVGLFRDNWIITPGIYYDYGLSHVTGNENWNLNTLMFQVDLRHAL